MTHVFYHKNDLDGQCSGAIVRYCLEEDSLKFKMHPFDYGDEFPFNEIDKYDNIIMVDITINPYERLLEIKERCYSLFVIDHHKSFIESDVSKKIDAYLDNSVAACILTWQYYQNDNIPMLVRRIGDYDVWNNNNKDYWNKVVLPTQMGLKLLDLDPSGYGYLFWKNYFNDVLMKNSCLKQNFFETADMHQALDNIIDKIVEEGNVILRYQANEDAKKTESFSFEAEFVGLKFICINSNRFSSNAFDSIWDTEKYDAMLCWANTKGKFISVSMYTDKEGIDVSKIAVSFGGGGHKQAAGFQCKELLIKNNNNAKMIEVIR